MDTSHLISFACANILIGIEFLTDNNWPVMAYLMALILIDYLMGITIAFMGKSPKTSAHGVSSYAAFTGLVRKLFIIGIVCCAYIVDRILGLDYIGKLSALSFVCSEIISILENAALMGIKHPTALVNALEVIKTTRVLPTLQPKQTGTGTVSGTVSGTVPSGTESIGESLEEAEDIYEDIIRKDMEEYIDESQLMHMDD